MTFKDSSQYSSTPLSPYSNWTWWGADHPPPEGVWGQDTDGPGQRGTPRPGVHCVWTKVGHGMQAGKAHSLVNWFLLFSM